ncbi:MAG TPA: HDOD domain-containing protein [Terracidiphilus sp.]|jgi:EAL and modified HD-GYP domain-containing signal transduction protein|nr:HDOD domain-containing protein [Terracidiphilus sp.]
MPHLDGTAPSPYSTETPQLARYVARQPILTPEERVFGYELLFRSGAENHFISSDPTDATRSVIDMSSLLGLGVLCDNASAFINCTREILLSEFVTLLPPENLVLEVLSTVPPDEEVMLACSQLKKTGVKIALDDYVIDDPREPLAYFADFIKVDLKQTPLTDAGMLVASHRAVCKMVAMKVETRQDFQFAKKAGFQLVQGYFFRRPQMVRTWTGSSNRAIHLAILNAVLKPELDLSQVEDLIKRDATLCFRLLRYLNSPMFGFRSEICSVRQALLILGENEVRRWCRLAVTIEMAQNRTSDLMLSALTRAHFCELLGPHVVDGNLDLFLLGLLSMMDSILEIPMTSVVDALSINHEVKLALLQKECSLTPLFNLMTSVEAGEWYTVSHLCEEMHISETLVSDSQWKAMEWAQQVSANDR